MVLKKQIIIKSDLEDFLFLFIRRFFFKVGVFNSRSDTDTEERISEQEDR